MKAKLSVDEAQLLLSLLSSEAFQLLRRELELLKQEEAREFFRSQVQIPSWELYAAMKKGYVRGIEAYQKIFAQCDQLVKARRGKRGQK